MRRAVGTLGLIGIVGAIGIVGCSDSVPQAQYDAERARADQAEREIWWTIAGGVVGTLSGLFIGLAIGPKGDERDTRT